MRVLQDEYTHHILNEVRLNTIPSNYGIQKEQFVIRGPSLFSTDK